jgi:hypothetical protein
VTRRRGDTGKNISLCSALPLRRHITASQYHLPVSPRPRVAIFRLSFRFHPFAAGLTGSMMVNVVPMPCFEVTVIVPP